MQLQLSFDLRLPDFASADRGELYAAMLDICEWADRRGFERAFFGEHHRAEDGHLPSPLAWAAPVFGHSLEHYPPIDDLAPLRASGAYQILAPEDAVVYLRSLGPDVVLILRPLFGGLDPDSALRSLDLFDQKVRPHLESTP